MKAQRILALILCTLLIGCMFVGCDKGEVVDGNLVIELDGNPTTGYTWVYEMSAEGIIEEVSSTYNIASGSDGLVGAGGTFRFEFAPVAPGEVGLQFSYLRTFENNSTIATKTYGVVVDEELQMTFYDPNDDANEDGDEDVSDSDANAIVAGSTYTETVVFGETEEDVVFTWTLCNAGAYVGVDTKCIEWYYANGTDTFAPMYPADEQPIVGTKMTIIRYIDADWSAKKYSKKLTKNNDLFTDFSKFDAEIDGLDAYGVLCSNMDLGISATYYFVQLEDDVVEIAIFYEGSNADDLGARLDAMARSITFTDTVGIIDESSTSHRPD